MGVPTSIAGMVDASIGGKTGINSGYGKNLIAFHSPILTDGISWLNPIGSGFSAGMAEIVKAVLSLTVKFSINIPDSLLATGPMQLYY